MARSRVGDAYLYSSDTFVMENQDVLESLLGTVLAGTYHLFLTGTVLWQAQASVAWPSEVPVAFSNTALENPPYSITYSVLFEVVANEEVVFSVDSSGQEFYTGPSQPRKSLAHQDLVLFETDTELTLRVTYSVGSTTFPNELSVQRLALSAVAVDPQTEVS